VCFGMTQSRGHFKVETSITCRPVPCVLRLSSVSEHKIDIFSDSPVTCRVDVTSSSTDADLRWAMGTPWVEAAELEPPSGRAATLATLVSELSIAPHSDPGQLPRTSHVTVASTVTPISGTGSAGGMTRVLDTVQLSLDLRT
jgi:hypothetical protein